MGSRVEEKLLEEEENSAVGIVFKIDIGGLWCNSCKIAINNDLLLLLKPWKRWKLKGEAPRLRALFVVEIPDGLWALLKNYCNCIDN